LILEELDGTQVLCKHICGVLVTIYEEDTSVVEFAVAGTLLQAVHSTIGSFVRSRSLSFTSNAG